MSVISCGSSVLWQCWADFHAFPHLAVSPTEAASVLQAQRVHEDVKIYANISSYSSIHESRVGAVGLYRSFPT